MRSFYCVAAVALVALSAAAESEEFWDNSFKDDPSFMAGEDFEKMMDEEDPAAGGPPMNPVENVMEPLNVEYLTKKFALPDVATKALLWTTFQDSSLPGWKKLADTDKFGGEFKVNLRENDWMEGDTGMQLTTKSAFHGLARQLVRTFDVKKDDSLYASMEVQYEKPVGCGGAYFKLFQIPNGKEASALSDQTPYSIMFGPDKCGHMTNKVHFIVKHPHPKKEGEFVEDHLSGVPRIPEGQESHQYGFEVHKDGTMKIYVDHKVEMEGNMKTLFQQPAFENKSEIDDPEDEKPADWVDEKRIADPDAVKPVDWDETAPEEILDMDAKKPEGWLDDEPLMVPNPEAEKPSDWDDAEDGDWKAPLVKNPACYAGCGEWTRPMKHNPDYKGKWFAPMIDNPEYKGEWTPRKIDNPDYYNIENPYSAIPVFNAVGFELWTVDAGAMIDNLIITTDKSEFHKFIEQTWEAKNEIEKTNIERKRAAEKAAMDKQASKAKAAADAQAGASTFFGMWKHLAQQSMTTLILTVTLPVATTLWVVSKVLKGRCSSPSSSPAAAEVAAKKKEDDDATDAKKKDISKKDASQAPEGDATAAASNKIAASSKKASGDSEEVTRKSSDNKEDGPRRRKESGKQ